MRKQENGANTGIWQSLNAAKEFLETGLTNDEGFEPWFLRNLGYTGLDRSDEPEGLEPGRLGWEDPFLAKRKWHSGDFELSDKKSVKNRFKSRYEEETCGIYENDVDVEKIGSTFAILNETLPNNKVSEIEQGRNATYIMKIDRKDLRNVHHALDTIAFPSEDYVLDAVGAESLDEVSVEQYIEEFETAYSGHVIEQLESVRIDEISEERSKHLENY